MNVDMQKTDEVLATVLQKALEGVQSGGEWLAGQIPDLAQQLLTFSAVEDIILILLWIGLGTMCLLMGRYWMSLHQKDAYSDWNVGAWIARCVAPIFIIPLLINFTELFKIYLAPKIWLLEYTAALIHTTK